MRISPLQIGDLTVPVPVCLAPMAGYTRAPFRAICRQFHCGLAFTEMSSNHDAIIQLAIHLLLDSAAHKTP